MPSFFAMPRHCVAESINSFLRLRAGGVGSRCPTHQRLFWALGGQIGALSMKWFWPALAIAAFLIVDRVYADGRGADELFSIVQWVGSSVRHWSDDLLRPLGR